MKEIENLFEGLKKELSTVYKKFDNKFEIEFKNLKGKHLVYLVHNTYEYVGIVKDVYWDNDYPNEIFEEFIIKTQEDEFLVDRDDFDCSDKPFYSFNTEEEARLFVEVQQCL